MSANDVCLYLYLPFTVCLAITYILWEVKLNRKKSIEIVEPSCHYSTHIYRGYSYKYNRWIHGFPVVEYVEFLNQYNDYDVQDFPVIARVLLNDTAPANTRYTDVVAQDSISEATGFFDTQGSLVFEGDLVGVNDKALSSCDYYEVCWHPRGMWCLKDVFGAYVYHRKRLVLAYDFINDKKLCIIGNVFQHFKKGEQSEAS